MRKIILLLLICFGCIGSHAHPVDADKLFFSLRDKVLAVKDYTADVKMKIDVSYMKIPQLRGRALKKSFKNF